ncbi:MAG TPA: GntR family transcriptional regulator [Acholeplasmataceae bacterium]|jgi:K+/H+ antiporter YhaU regulatory subunit KhtT|nr:GntR family transcriptional regulator [Acholeplasmataceae bacterium]
MKMKVPVYQQIAVDVASKIVEGRYKIGDKIYGRTSVATNYGVSAETARRAISLLDDMNVVESMKGSGVIIKSKENALKFLRQFQNIETLGQIERDIYALLDDISKKELYMKDLIKDMVDKVKKFESINPFIPYEIYINEGCKHLNKSYNDLRFWNNTKATIVGVRRDGRLILSPGPDETIKLMDVIYYIGDEITQQTVETFLYK